MLIDVLMITLLVIVVLVALYVLAGEQLLWKVELLENVRIERRGDRFNEVPGPQIKKCSRDPLYHLAVWIIPVVLAAAAVAFTMWMESLWWLCLLLVSPSWYLLFWVGFLKVDRAQKQEGVWRSFVVGGQTTLFEHCLFLVIPAWMFIVRFRFTAVTAILMDADDVDDPAEKALALGGVQVVVPNENPENPGDVDTLLGSLQRFGLRVVYRVAQDAIGSFEDNFYDNLQEGNGTHSLHAEIRGIVSSAFDAALQSVRRDGIFMNQIANGLDVLTPALLAALKPRMKDVGIEVTKVILKGVKDVAAEDGYMSLLQRRSMAPQEAATEIETQRRRWLGEEERIRTDRRVQEGQLTVEEKRIVTERASAEANLQLLVREGELREEIDPDAQLIKVIDEAKNASSVISAVIAYAARIIAKRIGGP